MHLPYLLLSLSLITGTSFAAPISGTTTDLAKRGPNFGGNCWVTRHPNGSTSYSSHSKGPNSVFRVGCMKAEREARQKEAAERREKTRQRVEAAPISEEQLACFSATKQMQAAGEEQTVQLPMVGEAEKGEASHESVIEDRISLVELHGRIERCKEGRARDVQMKEKWGWDESKSTKRACAGETGRLTDLKMCLDEASHGEPFI